MGEHTVHMDSLSSTSIMAYNLEGTRWHAIKSRVIDFFEGAYASLLGRHVP